VVSFTLRPPHPGVKATGTHLPEGFVGTKSNLEA